MKKYDCTESVLDHISNVRRFLWRIVDIINARASEHDRSKLQEPEKSMYDEYTPLLWGLTYGSPEYEETRKKMGVALEHHYKNNRHHPEYHERGVSGMNLIDLIEMLADWKAATLRHSDGDIQKSLAVNKERFDMSEQLSEILANTIRDFGW